MGFPFTPRSMILRDVELLKSQIVLEFSDISRVSESITAKRMKVDPYCQRPKLDDYKCTLQRCIDCVDIARRSSARGRQTTLRWQKQVFIHTRLSRANLALTMLSCCDNL